MPRIVEERYEQPDGSDYVLDTDLLEQALTATERKAGALNGLSRHSSGRYGCAKPL